MENQPIKVKPNAILPVLEEAAKVLHAFGDYSREMRAIEKNQKDGYRNKVTEQISSLNTVDGLAYLNKEHDILEERYIQANFSKDGFEKDYCRSILDLLIIPLIEIWERKVSREAGLQKTEGLPVPIIETTPVVEKVTSITEKTVEIVEDLKVEDGALEEEEIVPLPIGFTQIECRGSKEQITAYFSVLAKELNKNGEPFMTQQNVDLLIRKNFSVFGAPASGKYFEINLTQRQKGVLIYFVYQFYLKYEIEQIGTKGKYVNFLIWNFELFKKDDFTTLNKNMNASNRPSQNSIINSNNIIK